MITYAKENANQVYALARWAGLNDAQAIIATAISKAESGWNPENIGDQTLSKYGSRGDWQEYTGAHSPAELQVGAGPWTAALADLLEEPFTNAHAMWITSSHGRTWQPWSTYNDGAYKAYLSAARSASKAVGDNWHPWLPGVVVTHPAPTPSPAPSPGPSPTPAPPAGGGLSPKDKLRKAGNANPRAKKAVAFAAAQHSSPTHDYTRLCLGFANDAEGAPHLGGTALGAWARAGKAHQHTYYSAPIGVPVFWDGGSGHVAISDGQGNVWSSDIRRAGKVDLVPESEITSKWGKKRLGWLDALNGVSVYTAPGTATTKPLVPAPAKAPATVEVPAPAVEVPASVVEVPVPAPAPTLFPAAVSQAVADLQAEVAALQATLAALAATQGGA